MTMFKSAVAMLAGAMAAVIGTANAAHAAEPFIAEIRTFGEHACPAGWIPTDGRLLQVADHPALEAVIADRFGATSRRDFAVPNLKPPEGAPGKPEMQCISANGIYPAGNGYSNDHYIGDIRLFATTACPKGWVKTDGAAYPINHYVAFYAVLRHRYGGAGNLFRVPDNPPIFAVGHHALTECIASNGIFPSFN